MISRIDHVAVAVEDFDRAECFFRSILGAVPGSCGEDPESKFFWKIFSAGDLSRIEILTPTGEGSFLANFLKRRGQGIHHITLQTPDIAQMRDYLEQQGIPYFGYRADDDRWKELFIHPKDAFGMLLQVAEFRADEWLDKTVNLEPGRKWSIAKEADSFRLEVAHPGGGKVAIELSREELLQLKEDLVRTLEGKD
jgi:methylmalonyl-CoA/ethylmalonyl-CoA epimerase